MVAIQIYFYLLSENRVKLYRIFNFFSSSQMISQPQRKDNNLEWLFNGSDKFKDLKKYRLGHKGCNIYVIHTHGINGVFVNSENTIA